MDSVTCILYYFYKAVLHPYSGVTSTLPIYIPNLGIMDGAILFLRVMSYCFLSLLSTQRKGNVHVSSIDSLNVCILVPINRLGSEKR